MNNEELLRNAAKARGVDIWTDCDGNFYFSDSENREVLWNPINDDADAFDLLCNLPSSVEVRLDFAATGKVFCIFWLGAKPGHVETITQGSNSRSAVARMAIVRAAAAIGKGME